MDYAKLLPPLSTEEYASLKADLKENGQLHPVLVDEKGNVLDGRHRKKILGNGAKVKVIKGLSEPEKKAFVYRTNFARRNLSGAQKTEARKDMKATAKELREEDKKRWTQAKLAVVFGVTQKTVSIWNLFGKDRSNIPKYNTSTPDARVKIPAAEKPVIANRVADGEKQVDVAADYKVSQKQISNICKAEYKKAEKAKSRSKPKPATGKYEVLMADPPWRYDHSKTDGRKIENQYPTMAIEDIEALEVPAAKDCVLFLWATAPKLKEALSVMEAWGFIYKTHAIWDKQIIGMGYWFRGRHELLLVGTKGNSSPPVESARVASVMSAKRGKHSAKPAIAYSMVEKMFPSATRCELFARTERKGWKAWGNEV